MKKEKRKFYMKKEKRKVYMNNFHVPKCGYKWSHLVAYTQMFLATKPHPHPENIRFSFLWYQLVSSGENCIIWTSQGSHWTKLAPGYPCACTAPAANDTLLLCPRHQCSPCFKNVPSCEFCSLKWSHGRITWVIICQALFFWPRVARLRG